MKAIIAMMLFGVLATHLACNHCVGCRPLEKAETEISLNTTASHVQRRNYCVKDCSVPNTDAPICGRQLVYTTYIKREAHDNLYDDINDTPYMDKILGGNYAVYGEIPWIATILYNFLHICGGAIISEFWVISAAHCFPKDFLRQKYRIAVGDIRLSHKDDFESILQVDQIIKHEGFKVPGTEFDIALVKITRKKNGRGIEFNNYVQPVCLPKSKEVLHVGTPLLFAGWGATNDFNSHSSKLLKKVTLPVIENCKTIYPTGNTQNVFCAGYIHGDSDLCGGDSGGPAAARMDESFILYGIAVTSTGCKQPNQPAKFSDVAKHRFWIDTVIRMYSKDNEKVMPERNYQVVVVPLPD